MIVFRDNRQGVTKHHRFDTAHPSFAHTQSARGLAHAAAPGGIGSPPARLGYSHDTVHELAQCPVQRDALQRISMMEHGNDMGNAAASPDGRYLIFALVSEATHGLDIWVLDLPHRRAEMVLADVNPTLFDNNQWYAQLACVWSNGNALLTSTGETVLVEPAAMRARYVDVTKRISGQL